VCNFASLVLTKNEAFMGPTDSHTDIIELHRLKEIIRKEVQIVKFEITPPDKNLSSPLDQWIIVVDQDLLPPWFVAKVDSERALNAFRLSGILEIYKDYEAIRSPALKAYKAICSPAWEALAAINAPAWEAYEAIRDPAWEAYKAINATARKAYDAIDVPAWEAYVAKRTELTKRCIGGI
jgi:hypothetical protein